MLEAQIRKANPVSGLAALYQRNVAFAEGDDLIAGFGVGEKFAETPNAALVCGSERTTSIEPEAFQFQGTGFHLSDDDLQQFAAFRAPQRAAVKFESRGTIGITTTKMHYDSWRKIGNATGAST
jgi:hypothetical protein